MAIELEAELLETGLLKDKLLDTELPEVKLPEAELLEVELPGIEPCALVEKAKAKLPAMVYSNRMLTAGMFVGQLRSGGFVWPATELRQTKIRRERMRGSLIRYIHMSVFCGDEAEQRVY